MFFFLGRAFVILLIIVVSLTCAAYLYWAFMNAFDNSQKRLSTSEEGLQNVNTSFLEVNKRIKDYNKEVKN